MGQAQPIPARSRTPLRSLSLLPPAHGTADAGGARATGSGLSRRRGAAGAGQRPAFEAAEFAPAARLEAVREECGEKEELRRKPTMTVLVIGLGGVTNGGKTTLAKKLKKMLPNCDIISQDDFFKPESEVETDERGFKLYDVLDALYMDEMVKSIHDWMESPASSGVVAEEPLSRHEDLKNIDDVYILIVEGFLLYSYDTRVYQPADTPGYFDGHVWPMYLKYKNELEENASNIVYLDGTKSQDELLSCVYSDIMQELEKLKEGNRQVTAL